MIPFQSDHMANRELMEYFSSKTEVLKKKYEMTDTFQHNSRGFMRESFVKSVLNDVYPEKHFLTDGLIIDSDEEVSGEVDLAIYDEKYPVLGYENSSKMLSEGVLTHIEIKSNLYSNFTDVMDNAHDVKKLNQYFQVGYEDGEGLEVKKEDDGKEITSCVFAYEWAYEDMSGSKFKNFVKRLQKNYDINVSDASSRDSSGETSPQRIESIRDGVEKHTQQKEIRRVYVGEQNELPDFVCVLDEFCAELKGDKYIIYKLEEDSLFYFITWLIHNTKQHQDNSQPTLLHYTDGLTKSLRS